MNTTRSTRRSQWAGATGYTVLEMLIAMGIGAMVMGGTLTAMSGALRANEAVVRLTGMNNSLRMAMDLLVRDMLQIGSGLPPGHVILTPSGVGSSLIKIPGPPGTAYTNLLGDTDMGAVLPGSGLGPTVNGVPTDIITFLTADNNFTDMPISAMTATTVTIPAVHPVTLVAINIATGPDRVTTGQLMMLEKGSITALVQVTTVNTTSRVLTFAADSLNLNQSGAASGSLTAVNAAAPANTPANTRITRVRMISYYIDITTTPGQPRLVRRINNGHPTTFNNALGTAVGLDIENLQFTYDLADGATNPANVRFTAADLAGTGACAPNPCTQPQIRKINVAITSRSEKAGTRVYRNTLTSQVSLRGMAFVNEYQP